MPRQTHPGRTAEPPRTVADRHAEPRTTKEREEPPRAARDVDASPDDASAERLGRRIEVEERAGGTGALLRELIPELVVLLGAVYLFFLAGDFSARQQPGQLGPAFWPRLAAIGLALALLVRIVQAVREHRRPVVRVVSDFDEIGAGPERVYWDSVAIAMGLAVAYVIGTMFLGFMFATIVFLGAFIWLGGQRTWLAPAVAVIGGLVLTYVFVGVVYVSVPTGVSVFDTLTVAIYELLGMQ